MAGEASGRPKVGVRGGGGGWWECRDHGGGEGRSHDHASEQGAADQEPKGESWVHGSLGETHTQGEGVGIRK